MHRLPVPMDGLDAPVKALRHGAVQDHPIVFRSAGRPEYTQNLLIQKGSLPPGNAEALFSVPEMQAPLLHIEQDVIPAVLPACRNGAAEPAVTVIVPVPDHIKE